MSGVIKKGAQFRQIDYRFVRKSKPLKSGGLILPQNSHHFVRSIVNTEEPVLNQPIFRL
jgi:hypothetical protein